MDTLATDRLAIHGLARQRAANRKRHRRACQQQSMPERALLKISSAIGSLSTTMDRRMLIHGFHSLSKRP